MPHLLGDPAKVKEFLIGSGWISGGAPISVTPLLGGVSSHIWRIDTVDAVFVLKQPLEKLATERDWRSGVGRLEREVDCLRFLQSIMPKGRVPKLIAHDPVAHAMLMSSAPRTAGTWKGLLMGGYFDAETATAVGAALKTMHTVSVAKAEEIRSTFEDQRFFRELRIDPFHRALMEQYPGLALDIESLIDQLQDNATCLVHGDYSPKNILVADDGNLILLDFEVAHWGNPVFDLSTCIAHLMLKGWATRKEVEAVELIEAFLKAYDGDTEELLPHVGLMLLARLDGKSPVNYINDELARARIRSIGQSWICWKHKVDPIPYIYTALGVSDLI